MTSADISFCWGHLLRPCWHKSGLFFFSKSLVFQGLTCEIPLGWKHIQCWGLHCHTHAHIFDSILRNLTWAHFCLYRGKWNNPDSLDVAGAASQDPAAQVYPNITPTFPPACRSSFSRNFQRLWEARQLLGVRGRGQTRCTAGGGGSIPIPGPLSLPLSPLLYGIVLTEVEWWRGGGFTWGKALSIMSGRLGI